ncbi:hypothetical protein CK203_108958 [Vitis vinifera]|uniref:Uncharacterized protein n=1 Tax=Vitis vinifera TaxID=29760 RepID=A0A438BQ44_VITVI|nr:hypothetical protein CK203_108958 [Vitis vinifera]
MSEPPRPRVVPPLVEDASMSHPVRRYQTTSSSHPPNKKARVSEPELIDLSESSSEPPTEPQPSQPPPTESQIPSSMTPKCLSGVSWSLSRPLRVIWIAGLGHSTPSSTLTQPLSDFSPSSGTPSICCRDALLRHNIFPLQHWVQRRRVLLEALFRISEGFFFGPHHLIMVALLYFEEKVHRKKLLRADAIPLLFPRLLCQILEHLGYHLSLSMSVNSFAERYSLSTNERPVEIPADMRAPAPIVPSTEPIPEVARSAPHATPRTPPIIPATSESSSSSELRISISISEYRDLRAHQEQIIATQTQHTAILRQIQHHLGIPLAPEHPMPLLSKPTEPSQAPPFVEQALPSEEPTTGDAETST